MERSSRTSILTLASLGLLLSLAGASVAHNPALTVYQPAPLGDGLLVLGEEGTVALIDRQGSTLWNTSVDQQLIHRPWVGHGVAVTLARDIETLDVQAIAFDAEGLAWQTPVGNGSLGWITPTDPGFTVHLSDGRMIHLDPDGQPMGSAELPIDPKVRPVAHPEAGWVMADQAGTLVHVDQDGQVQAEASVPDTPYGLTSGQDQVLVGWGGISQATTGVTAYTAGLTEAWNHTTKGFRIGGQPSLDDQGLSIGTYDAQGAQVIRLDEAGQVQWQRTLANETAAAAAAHAGRTIVAVNSGIRAYDADGDELWRHAMDPLLDPPAVHDGLVLPAGASNRLVALDLATGEAAWTWDDGVRQVPWTDEGLARDQASSDPPPEDPAPEPTPGLRLATLVAAVALAATLAWRRP